jgi:hypothetical protein
MKKKWVWFSWFCLVLSLIPGLIASAAAYEFLDGKLTLSGFARNETGIRLNDRIYHDSILGTVNAKAEADKLSVMRSTFLLDGTYNMTDNLSFGFIFRSYYDAKWDLDDSLDNQHYTNLHHDDLRAGPDGDHLESDISLREWFVKWSMGDLKIKAGQQQIVWGEADGIRISDVINPLDFSKDFTTTAYGLNWEDVRIPQRMIDITYVVPESAHQYEVEVVLNPEDSRVNTYAPYGELYYTQGNSSLVGTYDLLTGFGFPLNFMGPPFTTITRRSFNDAFDAAIDDANPDSNSASFAGGMRLRGVFGGWDTHLFYYYQRAQNPVFTSSNNFSFGMMGIPFPWDVFDKNLGIKAHYPHISTVGGTFSYFDDLTATVFRGELGFTPDSPYSGRRQGTTTDYYFDPDGPGPAPGAVGVYPLPWGGWFNSDLVYKDTLTYMLGFDRPTWISFLNETNTFFISGQFIHKMIFDYNDTVKGENNKLLLSTVMGKDGFSDHQTMFTLKVDTKYYDDRIKPGVLVVWDVNGHDGYVKPSLRWNPTYDWSFEIGGLHFWADSYSGGPFGLVKDDDQIYGLIEYRF